MIKKFHSIITIFAQEKIMIDSYYITDNGEDHYRTDVVVNSICENELARCKENPHRIPGIESVMNSILGEIHKKDKKRIYTIEQASLTFITYSRDFDIIFIKPYSIYIDFLRNNIVDIKIGYGLYGEENSSFNEKDITNVMC